MPAKVGGGAGINTPALLRILASSIESADGNLQPTPTGQWRTLTISYMIRDTDNPDGRPQDVFVNYMTDLNAPIPDEDVVESEGQVSGQETS